MWWNAINSFILLFLQRVPWFSWMDSLLLVSTNNDIGVYFAEMLKFIIYIWLQNLSGISQWESLLICCVSGFRMLEAFNLTEKTYSYVKGVSMETGSFNSYTAYRLHKNAFLNQPTTWVRHHLTFIDFVCCLVDQPHSDSLVTTSSGNVFTKPAFSALSNAEMFQLWGPLQKRILIYLRTEKPNIMLWLFREENTWSVGY